MSRCAGLLGLSVSALLTKKPQFFSFSFFPFSGLRRGDQGQVKGNQVLLKGDQDSSERRWSCSRDHQGHLPLESGLFLDEIYENAT